MALRAADKAKKKAQENWRQRDREVFKIAQVNVRVPITHKDAFKRFGELLRDGKKPSVVRLSTQRISAAAGWM